MKENDPILILCTEEYKKQPRVLRTIEALRENYNISVAGRSEGKAHEVNFIDLSEFYDKSREPDPWHFNRPFLIRLPFSFYHRFIKQKRFHKPSYYEHVYWDKIRKHILQTLSRKSYKLIISHGCDTLPLAVKLSRNKTPVIFNAHEYYPLEFEQNKEWLETEGAMNRYFIRKYLPQCSYMFCVSGLIDKKYKEDCKVPSTVITNAGNYAELKPGKVDTKKIRIIHHGIALRERNIEEMASLIDYLDDRFELNLMLTVADKEYYDQLKVKMTQKKRINFLPPVPLSDLPTFLNKFDIGYYILPPVNFNTANALPNKLFEYVQARLCLAFAPSPEMKSVIENYKLGIVSPDFNVISMANKINALTEQQIEAFKANSDRHALELSAQNNISTIRSVVNKILSN